MGKLFTNDSFTDFVQLSSAAALRPELWVDALSFIGETTGAICVTLEAVNKATSQANSAWSRQIDGLGREEYDQRIFHINPRVRKSKNYPACVLLNDAKLDWYEDNNAAEFIDWLNKQEHFYLNGARLFETSDAAAYFTANFSRNSGPADEETERFLQLVTPHLASAFSTGLFLNSTGGWPERLRGAALNSGQAFALIDNAGALIECSEGFVKLVNSNSLLTLHDRRLVGRHASDLPAVENFLRRATGVQRFSDPAMSIRLTDSKHVRGIVLRALPLMPNDDVFDIFRPTALLTVVDLDAPVRAQVSELRALFGLTLREAEVAEQLVLSGSIAAASRHLQLSLYTVKQHLKVVFSKLEIERQSDLVALLQRLA